MRLLIVSPHFPPTNAADMQRVRLVLPYLSEHQIDAEVLVVSPEDVASPLDPWLVEGLPAEVPVHQVRALGLRWSRIPGLGTLGFRAIRALAAAGDDLLRGKDFDLVYFSTTVFAVHSLGRRWRRKFGVPFVMDYQDPWVSDYYREHPQITPPGGRVKYAIVSGMNRRQEPRVLRECSGITSVSAAYPEQLQGRYPWLAIRRHGTESPEPSARRGQVPQALRVMPSLVLPFPGDRRDFERVKKDDIRQSVFDPKDGLRHWVYVGRGGGDMALALRGIFAALAKAFQKPEGIEPRIGDQASETDLSLPSQSSLRLHFIGTSYAAAGRGLKTIEPLAQEFGLGSMVSEHPNRISYSETLRCLLDAEALIVPGSDDPGYTASKIYPYLLAEKPMLAVFHEQSSVVDLIRKVGGGRVVPFVTGETPATIAARIDRDWLAAGGPVKAVPLDPKAFAPYAARAQAQMLAVFFKEILEADRLLKK